MVDRSVAPAIHDIKHLKLPEFKKSILNNGVPLGLIPRKDHPVVMLNVVIPSGSQQEQIPGVTYFAAKMLSEGTSSLNSYQIASKIDFYGGHLEISPSPDYVSIKLYCARKFFPTLLPLVSEILHDSQFPEKEFDTLKQIRIQHIRQQLSKNNVVAGLQLRKCLFGTHHPYGRILEEKDVNVITHEAAFDYYRNGLLRSPKIYLAGDVDDSEINQLEKEFSIIKFLQDENDEMPAPTTSDNVHIDKAESVQTSIRMGNLSIRRDHSDHFSLKVANELLGGYFGSRLMTNIREKKGLTYGIYSSLVHFNQQSFWQIGTDVLKEKKDEAVSEIIKEIKILQNTPPSVDELFTLKNYMMGKIASSFDTVLDAADLTKTLDLVGLDLDYWNTLFNTIDRIQSEDISAIAVKYFDTEKIRLVTVG
ncbi:MAG: M16 family metallopeptidase [Bacteroidota bacterium]